MKLWTFINQTVNNNNVYIITPTIYETPIHIKKIPILFITFDSKLMNNFGEILFF